MKSIICIALSALLLCAMSIHISAETAVQEDKLPHLEASAEQFSAEAPETHAETEAVPDEITEPLAEPVVTDLYPEINSEMIEREDIPVEDIEVSDFKSEMYVNDTQNLYATVFPNTATNQTIRCSSSNNAVATVSNGGKITAVGKGSCRIYVSCAEVTKYYSLTVKVQTEAINVISKFIVLKPGEHFDLEATVQPAEASQELKFKANDDTIVSVSDDGILTAGKPGSTSVIVSNEDSTILVNVIVNTDKEVAAIQNPEELDDASRSQMSDNLARQIRENDEREITVKGLKCISSEVLKALYGTDKTLTVDWDEYMLSIRGQDIFNPNNEINTKLELSNTDNGMYVTINEKNNLPGTVSIFLRNAPYKYKYFYLVNEQECEYQALNSLSDNSFKVSSMGKYLLSTRNMNRTKINLVWILSGAGAILLLSVIYIFTKKKYWLW